MCVDFLVRILCLDFDEVPLCYFALKEKKGFTTCISLTLKAVKKRCTNLPKNPKDKAFFPPKLLTEKTEVRSNGYSTCSLSISSPSCYTFDGGSALWQL